MMVTTWMAAISDSVFTAELAITTVSLRIKCPNTFVYAFPLRLSGFSAEPEKSRSGLVPVQAKRINRPACWAFGQLRNMFQAALHHDTHQSQNGLVATSAVLQLLETNPSIASTPSRLTDFSSLDRTSRSALRCAAQRNKTTWAQKCSSTPANLKKPGL